jgi:hypothetical protein
MQESTVEEGERREQQEQRRQRMFWDAHRAVDRSEGD